MSIFIINIKSGEVDLGEGYPKLRPFLELSEFLQGSAGVAIDTVIDDKEWKSFKFQTREFSTTTIFHNCRLKEVDICDTRFGPSAWSAWSRAKELERKDVHDRYLAEALGKPPYNYEWGEVLSSFDEKGGGSSIVVRYR